MLQIRREVVYRELFPQLKHPGIIYIRLCGSGYSSLLSKAKYNLNAILKGCSASFHFHIVVRLEVALHLAYILQSSSVSSVLF